MQYREFGPAGMKVSEIGFGTWGMGGSWWGGPIDKESKESLNLAIECGVNFFDTAYVYGDGHSEELIAQVVNERKVREKVFIATKVPPKNWQWPAEAGSDVNEIFPPDWIRRCTERSLKKLKTDYVDLQQLHVWASSWLGTGDWLNELQKLKKEGKVRWIGISINDHQPDTALDLVKSGLIDSVQVIYNIFDQSPEEKLLPLCREHRVGVIVRVPLDEGGLSGKLTPETKFAGDDWRGNYFRGDRLRETCDRIEKLKPFLGDEAKTVSDLALKFCLSHPAVSTVIPGMRRAEHLRSNVAASNGKSLSAKLLQEIKKHAWQRNFYL
ncbi:MAG: aldo/keto reductase [Deltaproteobacteria bacterium]|nr:aldo/keto reductase [Deltaproteobacteria bacterium]